MVEREPQGQFAALGQLIADRHDVFWFAIDIYQEYKYLNELWDNGDARWKVWGSEMILERRSIV